MRDILFAKNNKAFLSPEKEEFSSVAWSVELVKEDQTDSWVYSYIRFGDCVRSVTVSMGVTISSTQPTAPSPEQIRKNIDARLLKLDTLIKELTDYREAYWNALSVGKITL